MREPVSVVIPTYNVEDRIRDCLSSVDWADEILVVDSFSTDRTVEICREYTDRILNYKEVKHSTPTTWAVPQTSHKWFMVVDSTERVSEQLRDSILQSLEEPGEFDGFELTSRDLFFGKPMKQGGWGSDYTIRLVNKESGGQREKSVHRIFEVGFKVGRLDGPLYHYTYESFDEYFEQFHPYTSWSAKILRSKARRATWINLALRPWMSFLEMYVLRRGFLDGRHGLVLSFLTAFNVFTKYARLWEIEVGDGDDKTADVESTGPAAVAHPQTEGSRGKS
jgi:glycosyltransferase involved in cell wall biosynthesis